MAPDRARYIDSWTRLLQQPSRAFSFFANERRGGDPSIQEVNLLLGGDSFRLHAGLESPSSLDDVIITCVKGQVPSGFPRKLIFFWNVRVQFTLFTQEKGRENVHVELMEQFFCDITPRIIIVLNVGWPLLGIPRPLPSAITHRARETIRKILPARKECKAQKNRGTPPQTRGLNSK